jgi:hypothetical protein
MSIAKAVSSRPHYERAMSIYLNLDHAEDREIRDWVASIPRRERSRTVRHVLLTHIKQTKEEEEHNGD